MKRKIPHIGLAMCIMYFVSVVMFLIFKTETTLTIWEIFTIAGAPASLFVLLELSEQMQISSFYTNTMLVFMACTCTLTGLAHFVNIAVTRKLIAAGVDVPDYFQIGYWPSVEMAVDYLAWGFFMGLAFLTVGGAIVRDNKYKTTMRRIVLACGILCFVGFFGTMLINENLWYFAPLGYGAGTAFICIKMIRQANK